MYIKITITYKNLELPMPVNSILRESRIYTDLLFDFINSKNVYILQNSYFKGSFIYINVTFLW